MCVVRYFDKYLKEFGSCVDVKSDYLVVDRVFLMFEEVDRIFVCVKWF